MYNKHWIEKVFSNKSWLAMLWGTEVDVQKIGTIDVDMPTAYEN